MHLTDEEILKMLIDYVTDNRYKQAILIDGEWGSGKTYFVKEKLLSKLKHELQNRSVYYMSLYGLDDFAQIMHEIYTVAVEDFFDKKLGEGKGNKLGKGMNFASKLFSTGLKYFNVDPKDLPSLDDIKQIKDAIIIFDDLERCNIDINQLLGFINNLAEHNNIKVIIVANQAEIGKTGISSDLAQKYLVALDSRISLDEVKEGKKDGQNTDEKSINKEKLISRMDKLFSEDILYEKIKEKLIGLIIYYKADFDSIYECIIDKYVNDKKTKKQLKVDKQVVVDIFEKKQHYNIRTLIFGIMAYERFFKICDTITSNPPKYLNEHKKLILKYTMELSIRIKTGKPVYLWNNSTAQTGEVYLEESASEESIFGYKFVDTYLLNGYLNSEKIGIIIKSIISEEKKLDECHRTEKELVINKLYRWHILEDEEIADFLVMMKKELEELEYSPNYFKNMIFMLIQMEHNNLDGIKYEEYINLMKIKLEEYNDPFEREKLEILSYDSNLLEKYNTLAQPLFDIVDRKEKERKRAENDYLNNSEPWNNNFAFKCQENKSNHMEEKKFFFYMDINQVIANLEISKVIDIYSFLEGIKSVYNFSNLNDFFKADVSNIKSLLEKMDIEKLSNGKHTRRIVLDKLKEELKESLKRIEK